MAWAGLDDFLARIEARLDHPERDGQLDEHGDFEFLEPDEQKSIRPAAVLIGILPRASGPTALLTLRPDTMPTHAGQVAFPGGKVDPGDVNDIATALREAEEEVGVRPDEVNILGIARPYVSGNLVPHYSGRRDVAR